GATFSDIFGANAASYTVTAAGAVLDNSQYQVIVTSDNCAAYTSNNVILRVNAVTSATVNGQTVCAGTDAVFSVTTTHTGPASLSYQWKRSTNGGVTFSDIAGENNTALTVPAPGANSDNYKYENVVTIGNCDGYTSNATILRVNEVTAASVANQTVCSGNDATFAVAETHSGSGTLAYQWMRSTDNGSTFSNIAGATSASYVVVAPDTNSANYEYENVVTIANCGAFTSTHGVLIINTAPHITGGINNMCVCPGYYANFWVTATGSDLKYQWRNGNVNLIDTGNISGANTSILTIAPVRPSDTSSNYNVIVSGTCSPNDTSGNGALTLCSTSGIAPNLDGNAGKFVSVFPNPFTSTLFIKI